MVRLCQLLGDRDCLDELVCELFNIDDKKLFSDALKLFTTKELRDHVRTTHFDITLTNENNVEYILKLYSDTKRYKRYMTVLFSEVNIKNIPNNLLIPKELWDDLMEYIELKDETK